MATTFNSDRLIEALKRKRFFTGKLAETLEIPVDALHKIIVTSEGDDLVINKLNALLDEAEPAEELGVGSSELGIKDVEDLVSKKWAEFETSFQNKLTEDFANWYQNLEVVSNKTVDLMQKLLIEAFIILTPVQRLKQAVEEGKLSREQILAAENKSPVPRTTVIDWAKEESAKDELRTTN